MSTTVAVRAYFHTAHRLPALAGKCSSLHGHSWEAWFTLGGPVDEDGVVADFGDLKAALRGWCMEHLDHGTALGADDPLVPVLADHGTKLYVLGRDAHSEGLRWPTVENMACLLHRVAAELLPAPVVVRQVLVQETENNRAVYRSGGW